MPESLIVLRDLPGVGELEALCAIIATHRNPEWAPERDGLTELAGKVSRALFGLTEDETHLDHADLPDRDYDLDELITLSEEWERNFEFIYTEDSAAEAVIWRTMGWDVGDGRGGVLLSLEHLSRQMVCAVLGLRGRMPGTPPSDEEISSRTEGLAEKLAAESAKFQLGRRRR